ncbi:copper resistance CopC/CopD family protein [Mycobacterium sp. 141]|uniref:copper resistance CopC/CopD family protein n=1 Tax=Mycobacterium sp. 141 TaxID=1120797 RepID=UPI0003725770|nr:copper resistance protein CopC [Mycobacterium sp. 141]
MRSASSAGAVLGMLVVALLTLAPVAHAHAVLVASDPVDGARLSSAPAAVELTFDEPVRLIPGAVQVISASGARVSVAALLHRGGTVVELPLNPGLPQGSYTAMWRVISADTHEVSGSVSFGVGQDPLAAEPSVIRDPLARAAAAARGVVYVGLVLGIGVTAVCWLFWGWAWSRSPTRILVRAGWALIVAGTAAQFVFAGAQSQGLGWSGVADAAGASQVVLSPIGVVLGLRLVLALVLAATTWRSGANHRRAISVVAAVFAVGLVATVAVDGHAGVGADAGLATAVTTVHLVAMSVWLGGLLVLVLVVLPAGRTDRLGAWSQTAFGCVAVLVLTGEYQAWRQILPIESLWSTGYGITLLAKLAAVSVMLGFAYLGRRRLTAARLRRTVPIEAAVGGIVIIITTVLVAQPPARTVYGPPITLSAPLDNGRSVAIRLSTTRRGPLVIDLTVNQPPGSAPPAQTVSASLSSVDAGIASLPVRWESPSADRWHSTFATAPRPGMWTLYLTVGFNATDAVATTARFRVW